jgi:hypothetical protein
MEALTLDDAPRPQEDGSGHTVLIRARCPVDFEVPKAFHQRGGHNQVFVARHRSSKHEAVIFRRNTDTKRRDPDIEEEVAAEIAYGIELHALNLAPAVYDYGFCPARKNSEKGYYWQVLEKFDGSLYEYMRPLVRSKDKRRSRRRSRARLCGAPLRYVEEQLIRKFRAMARHHMFCMDIHARNVVVRQPHGRPLELQLIDFDHTFCVSNSRIRFSPKERAQSSSTDAFLGEDSKLPIYVINVNNLLIALLLCFSSNTHEICGRQPFFRQALRDMLAGRSRWLSPKGGAPDLNKVLTFLTVSRAQGHSPDTTLRVMQHWTHWVDHEKATARRLASIVLGRYVSKRQVPVPWPLPRPRPRSRSQR